MGLPFGRVGDKAHGEELSEGASEDVPDVSTCGIEHQVGESVHIPRDARCQHVWHRTSGGREHPYPKRCQMSARVASNIRLERASISQEVINEFFDELVAEVGDIHPEKMFNLDETNFTDHRGMKNRLVRCGACHDVLDTVMPPSGLHLQLFEQYS